MLDLDEVAQRVSKYLFTQMPNPYQPTQPKGDPIPAAEVAAQLRACPQWTDGRHWYWHGFMFPREKDFQGGTYLGNPKPTIRFHRKRVDVRRLLWGAIQGEPLASEIRVYPGCTTWYCVNPRCAPLKKHGVPYKLIDPIQELIDMILLVDGRDFTKPTLYARFDGQYSIEQIAEAKKIIKAKGL
jgi:hypothetical protein